MQSEVLHTVGRNIPAKLIDVCVASGDRSVGWPCFDIVVLMLMS